MAFIVLNNWVEKDNILQHETQISVPINSFVGTQPSYLFLFYLWLFSCCHDRVERLQQRLYGLQSLKYFYLSLFRKSYNSSGTVLSLLLLQLNAKATFLTVFRGQFRMRCISFGSFYGFQQYGIGSPVRLITQDGPSAWLFIFLSVKTKTQVWLPSRANLASAF